MIEVGQAAPDFSLPDQAGTTVSLSGCKGSPVVLYFYPKDDTPGCTKEACAFRDAFADTASGAHRSSASAPTIRHRMPGSPEVRPSVHAARRRGTQGLRGLRRLEGEEHVRAEVHGRGADRPSSSMPTGWSEPSSHA